MSKRIGPSIQLLLSQFLNENGFLWPSNRALVCDRFLPGNSGMVQILCVMPMSFSIYFLVDSRLHFFGTTGGKVMLFWYSINSSQSKVCWDINGLGVFSKKMTSYLPLILYLVTYFHYLVHYKHSFQKLQLYSPGSTLKLWLMISMQGTVEAMSASWCIFLLRRRQTGDWSQIELSYD